MNVLTRPRAATAALATAALAAGLAAAVVPPSQAAPRNLQTVQLLSFNDFHGHLEANDPNLSRTLDPSQTPSGGAEYLAAHLQRLRDASTADASFTVAAGDLIGGSPFLSGAFHDEPAVESLNALGLDVSGVGNHEFDEGTEELLRMQEGGCHPVDGCYFEDAPYAGADFQWLAANVRKRGTDETLLPATSVKDVDGTKVGFIGMTLEATDTLVNPAGVSSVRFLDEVLTANREARKLKQQGVKSIVVLLHEGGLQTGTYQDCTGISGAVVGIAEQLNPEIDAVITGHTHQPYVCNIPDPRGKPRLVTSAASFGQVVTETELVINKNSGDVLRDLSTATNHLVARSTVTADPEQTAIIAKWQTLAGPVGSQVVGQATADIGGDGVTGPACRCEETPMGNLMADAILWGTSAPADGGAQLALINVGGIRAPLAAGEITYAEAYAVQPFGNVLVTLDLTGAQLDTVLEQQYQPVSARGSRPTLALGTSAGFSYTWDATQPQGSRASGLTLNGTPVDPAATYRVGTLNFLAAGGDLFTEFTNGTNLLGAEEDVTNLVEYLGANNPVSPPATDRVNGL